MDTSLILLLQEYLNYETAKVRENSVNTMSSNLKSLGLRVGEKVMLKLTSAVPFTRTKDIPAASKFFLDTFWEAMFGKKVERISLTDKNRLTFSDQDFELISRISSRSSDSKVLQENCKNLVRHIIEGAMGVLFLRCDIDIVIEGKGVQFTIDINEIVT